MVSKMKDSKRSISFFIVFFVSSFFVYQFYLRQYFYEHSFGPSNVDPNLWIEEWISNLDNYFMISKLIIVIIMILWFFVIFKEIDLPEAQKIWGIFFGIFIISSIIIPSIFTFTNRTDSNSMNMSVFVYFFVEQIMIFILSTLYCYPAIRKCSGIWKIIREINKIMYKN